MILIVTYDLRSPKDYHEFYEAVKQQGKWWHYMASTWLLSTEKTPQEVVNALLPHMDVQDLLFVCQVSSNYQGRLPKPAWDWINTELPNFPNLAAISTLFGAYPPTVPPVPGGSTDIFGPPKTDIFGLPKKDPDNPLLPSWMTPPPTTKK